MKKTETASKTMIVLKVMTYLVALALVVTGVIEGLRMNYPNSGMFAFMAMFAFFAMVLVVGVHVLEAIISVRHQLKRIADAQANAGTAQNIAQTPLSPSISALPTQPLSERDKVWYHARQGIGH